MGITNKTDQGGSVVFSVLIGIFLIIILFGTIYFVRQRSEQARQQQAIAKYDQEKAKEDAKPQPNSDTTKTVAPEDNDEPAETVVVSVELPNTGASTSMVELVGIFAITTALVGFMDSRRNLARYL